MPRQFAPATERNREAILAVLKNCLLRGSHVLEVASGTGEHAVFMAGQLPEVIWQPSDREPGALESIEAWRLHSRLENVRPAIKLDVEESWPNQRFDAVFCANMIHIAPWSCTLGLLEGVARVLHQGGQLITYGPYRVAGEHTAPSNARFEQWLLEQDPRFGVRDMDEVRQAAEVHGLSLEDRISMPANNFCLLFKKA